MAFYITTAEDLHRDKKLVKTACTLRPDDILFLLSGDPSVQIKELQQIAEKKRFCIRKVTVISAGQKGMDAAYSEEISKIINTFDGEQETMIFVGKILLKTVICLYDFLDKHSIHIEARIAGFNPPKRILSSKSAIETAYKKQQEKRENKKPTLEFMMDEEGETSNVSITIPDPKKEEKLSADEEIPEKAVKKSGLQEDTLAIKQSGKTWSIGQVAGREIVHTNNAIYQNGQGNTIIAPKKSRRELEKSIFRKTGHIEQKETGYSPEMIEKVLAYEQVMLRTRKYFLEHLKLAQMTDREFYTMLNLIQASDTKEEWIRNMALELPRLKVTVLSETEYQAYTCAVKELTEAMYQFCESGKDDE